MKRPGSYWKRLRGKLGISQGPFWKRVHVTQSGGSRYEAGRRVPKPVELLLDLAYGPTKAAELVVQRLRKRMGRPRGCNTEVSIREP